MSAFSTICDNKTLILDQANLKRFARIFLPVMFLLSLISITGFFERSLLADYSKTALTGGLNAFFLARVFQSSCLAVVVVGQAFVGLYHGAGQHKSIGPCVWQLIWFSLFSMVFVIPVGFVSEQLLFQDTAIEIAESSYFSLLCTFNFLFPLGSALQAFYLGRGITKPIVFLTIGTCLLNIGLDYVLIFGWGSVPSLGVTGAALGRVISQGFLCLVLFSFFFSRSNQEAYGTKAWRVSPKLFWHYVRPGLLRALAAFPALGDWVLVSRFMSLESETHMLVFSLGSTLFYLLAFIGDGLFQTMVTVASNHIGKKEHSTVWTSYFSGLVLLAVAAIVLLVPFFLYPQALTAFFSRVQFYDQVLITFQGINKWLWLAVIAYALNALSLGLIIAARDTLFLLGFYCGMWLVSFVPVYVAMSFLGWQADKFWLIVMGTNFTCSIAFLWRASQEKWKIDNWQPKLPPTEINLSLN